MRGAHVFSGGWGGEADLELPSVIELCFFSMDARVNHQLCFFLTC